ncbi:transmembrane amino acid transporter protein-domain-containing protein [Gautieria morchelliformis]|nr:transmembrane amino acid transporter protein-domain-containing protein [Gautieria morchelliformis]
MAAQPASLPIDSKDPRVADDVVYQAPSSRKIPFEELLHYAAIQRKRDDETLKSGSDFNSSRFGGLLAFKGEKKEPVETTADVSDDEKARTPSPVTVTEDDRTQARRAIRTATWLNIFYLITTDILGPTSAPWAFAQLGFVSGVLLFFFLGLVAFYTGMQLWHMYLKLDSNEYPIQNYSDLTERIFGRTARHCINVLQTIQLLFNVAVLVIANAQGLSQMSKGRVCFSVLAFVWMLAGMIIGQVRSLQNYGGLAHWAIWMNLLVIFITMGAVANSAPNFASALKENAVSAGPVMTQPLIHQAFQNQIVGVMQMVYAYGGAMLFIEFMAEMKRPFDFWKGMVCAQLLIVTVYLLFGVFVYAFQGQFTINPANQGISGFGLQTATNAISLVSALVAAGLYGNIGIKVIYVNIIQDLFNGPALISRKGRFIWIGLVIGYWAFAFVVGSAIPQFSNISGIVAAICILQFTYTFPPILYVGFTMQKDAIEGQIEYTPGTAVETLRRDTWYSWSRWQRGFAKRWWLNTFNILLFLAALATAGLGAFSSIQGIITTFATNGSATSFGCGAPV